MNMIAIIPARSGSKGLKDKNIRDFCGKPLLVWSIEAAKRSHCFDEIMVSTDSQEYANIAISNGANVPFLRSSEMSSDTASTWDAVREIINMYEKIGRRFDAFCLLQPTSPLRTHVNIINAVHLFNEKGANSVIGVCELEHSLSICNSIPDNLSMDGFFDSRGLGRRQDMPKTYRINGAIYIQRVKNLLNMDNLYGEKSFAYIMDKLSSVDIDDEIDFIIAESLSHITNPF